MVGTLYLIPSPLAAGPLARSIPNEVVGIARSLPLFFVENEKNARAYLKLLEHPLPMREIQLVRFDVRATDADAARCIQLIDERGAGVLSEGGCPCVADPGTSLVRMAHLRGIPVRPLVGPSSIVLVLMASGLNAQRFSFVGYLPVEHQHRLRELERLLEHSRNTACTIVCIETPYRANALFEFFVKSLPAGSDLCVASDLSGANEVVVTRKIAQWKLEQLAISKVPTIFAFQVVDRGMRRGPVQDPSCLRR